MVFYHEELDYKVGVKIYCGVFGNMVIHNTLMEVYKEYDDVYKESIMDKNNDEKEWRK